MATIIEASAGGTFGAILAGLLFWFGTDGHRGG